MNRSSENKALIYKWTGESNLAEVTGFQQKVTAWDMELEKRRQSPCFEEWPGEEAEKGAVEGRHSTPTWPERSDSKTSV